MQLTNRIDHDKESVTCLKNRQYFNYYTVTIQLKMFVFKKSGTTYAVLTLGGVCYEKNIIVTYSDFY